MKTSELIEYLFNIKLLDYQKYLVDERWKELERLRKLSERCGAKPNKQRSQNLTGLSVSNFIDDFM